MRVLLDATVGTPFLVRPLQRDDPAERPDFVIHSYTKDLSGAGSVIAGEHDIAMLGAEGANGGVIAGDECRRHQSREMHRQ